MRKESFVPSRDGFAFPNAFDLPGCGFGLGAPLRPSFGLGAGMAWLALDRYLEGRPVSCLQEPPAPPDPLVDELVLRQANALAAASWDRLIEWQCRPEHGLPWRPGLAELSRAQWRRIRHGLDASMPVLVFLVLASGRHANPSANKAVLAVGYEIDRRDRRAHLLVYDPGRPGKDNIRLAFRIGRFDPLDARLAIQTQVRGFFAVPYDRPLPAAISLDASQDMPDTGVQSMIGVWGSGRRNGPLDLLARARGGGLVHLRRDRRARWTAESVETDTSGDPGTVSQPGAVAPVRPGHLIARATTGDLREFRRWPFLGWRARAITSTRRIDGGFRCEGTPAALRRRDGRLAAVAYARGSLLHYHRDGLRGWRAERVSAASIGQAKFEGTPVLVELERGGLHVLCRTDSGDLMHLRHRRKSGWVAENATMRAGGRGRFGLVGDPIVVTDCAAGCLNVVALSQGGNVLLYRWQAQRGWRGFELSDGARAGGNEIAPALSPLAAALDPKGTVHVVARTTQGGLIHLWCDRSGAQGGEEVTRMRTATGELAGIDGAPVVAALGADVHVYARQGLDLLLFRWTAVRDWSFENLTREQAQGDPCEIVADPLVMCTRGAVHVSFADGRGRAREVCAALEPRTQVGGLHSTLADRVADAAAAMVRPIGAAAAVFEQMAGIPERVRKALENVRLPSTQRTGPAAAGIGARFVRGPAHAPRSVAAGLWAPGRAGAVTAAVVAAIQNVGPRLQAAAPATRGNTGDTPGAKPRPHPALEGLPFLADDAGAGPPPTPPVVAAAATPAQPPHGKREPNAASNQRELQRILALAEEDTPQLIRP